MLHRRLRPCHLLQPPSFSLVHPYLTRRHASFSALLSPPHPSSPAVTDSHGTHTYGHLVARADTLRRVLPVAVAGSAPPRVALLLPADARFCASLLATWRAGLVAVPLSPLYPRDALRPLLRDAHPAVTVVVRETLVQVPGDTPGHVLVLDDVAAAAEWVESQLEAEAEVGVEVEAVAEAEVEAVAEAEAEAEAEVDVRGWIGVEQATLAEAAMILYTSGTTGAAKGVVWTRGMVDYQLRTLSSAWRWHAADVALNVLPLHHVHGLVNVVLSALAHGAHLRMHDGVDVGRVWREFEGGGVSVFMAVPAVYRKLIASYEEAAEGGREWMRKAAGSVRLFVCGSAALPKRDFEMWEAIAGQRVLERYGMTETGMTLANEYERRRQGVLGVPLPGVQAQVRGGEKEQGGAEVGRLLVRGPGVFGEYWRRPAATREAFGEGGWFDTGDVVEVVKEGGGFRMLGRASVDIIKTGGYKVSAIEVEEVLRECEGVVDSCVVGVEDEVLGERVVAAVVVQRSGHEEALKRARRVATEQLPRYKVPREFCVVEELPRNAVGKVQKKVLKALLGRRAGDDQVAIKSKVPSR